MEKFEHGIVLRTFVAVPLNKMTVQALSTFIEHINDKNNLDIRWVKPKHFHITLKFLPKTSRIQLVPILEEIQQAANRFNPFPLRLDTLGVFPHINNPKVLWASVLGDLTTLKSLHRTIDSNLSSLGFFREKYEIIPHITLGRIRSTANSKSTLLIKQIINSNFNFHAENWIVSKLRYIESTLTETGPVYKTIGVVPLGRAR